MRQAHTHTHKYKHINVTNSHLSTYSFYWLIHSHKVKIWFQNRRMKWKRSKKAAQEAKQNSKTSSDSTDAKNNSSDNEFESDSSRNYVEAESSKCKSSPADTSASISLFTKTMRPENDLAVTSSKWSPSGMSRHLVDCARSSISSTNHGVIVSTPGLSSHSHRHSSVLEESFYRHFVS